MTDAANDTSALSYDVVRANILALTTDPHLWEGSYQQAAARVCAVAVGLTGASCASVWQWDDEHAQLSRVAESAQSPAGAAAGTGELAASTESPGAMFLDGAKFPSYILALREHRVMTVDDVLTDPRTSEFAQAYSAPKGLVSLMDVTVRRKGQLDGVLCLEQLHAHREWSMQEIALAVDLADLLGQLSLFNESRLNNQLHSVLRELSRHLPSAASIMDVCELALDSVQQQFPEFWLGLYVPDALMHHANLLCMRGNPLTSDGIAVAQSVPIGTSMTGLALREARTVYIHDFSDPNLHLHFPLLARAQGDNVKCGLAIALVHGKRALASLTVWARGREFLSRDELTALEIIASSFAGALAHAMQLQELQERAFFDDSSELGNYVKLREDLKACDPEQGWQLAVLRVRNYSRVIATIGRANTKQLVRQMAARLLTLPATAQATAYRVSEDQFALLLPHEGAEDNELPPWVHTLQQLLHQPVSINGVPMGIRMRFGLARYPQHTARRDELLHRAEAAAEAASEDNAPAFLYLAARDKSNENHLSLIAELDHALRHGGLSLHLQPKINIRTSAVTGAEALLRWHHPRLGHIPPDKVVHLAEASDLMDRLTDWVADQALAAVTELRLAGRDISVAVNISANNLLDAGFPRRLGELLAKYTLPASCLRLELTETALLQEGARATRVIEALVGMGIALEIDDFGTGYSSLSYLKHLPLATVKLDRSFVADICIRATDSHIVASVIRLAAGLGMSTVAEGVEDAQTLEQLNSLGCTHAQGYFISRPMALKDFMAWHWPVPLPAMDEAPLA